MKIFFFFNLGLLLNLNVIAQQNWTLLSPDQNIKVDINLTIGGLPSYTVSIKKAGVFSQVVNNSKLGLLRNDCDFRDGLTFNSQTTQTIDENYTMLTGKQLLLRNNGNELQLDFTKCGVTFRIIFRAYNDGIAFRYAFPDQSNIFFTVFDESSSVRVNVNGNAWMQESATIYPVYEDRFTQIPVGTSSNSDAGWSLPALLNPDNTWILISESDANENFYASHLKRFISNGEYEFTKPYSGDGIAVPDNPLFQTPMKTPWRVIMLANEVSKIVESSLIDHLSSPNALPTTNWIKPGMATWNWWSGFQSARDYNRMLPFIDLASTQNYAYALIDAEWDKMTNGSIPQLVTYANTKNVKLWIWYNSGGPLNAGSYANNISPRDLMHIKSIRRDEFQKIKNWGVVGIKVDFFMSDKQDIMKYYIDLLKDAADFELMVNFHGSTIPRGWQRTYPNLMTMEAVKGAEALLFDGSYRNDSPTTNVNLVFTRNIIGSMDYTPGIIDNMYYSDPFNHVSTGAHELALVTLFESGVQHLCDYHTKYQALFSNYPTIKTILKEVPTTWDETKFVEGSPGDYVVLARRKGNDWFVSGINSKNTAKAISFNTNFLASGQYDKLSFEDGASQFTYHTNENTFVSGSNISAQMAAYGGFTVKLKLKCLNLLTINQNISTSPSDKIKAKAIVADNKILNNSVATYSANNSVELKQGFEAVQGSIFTAEILGCPTN